MRFCTFYLATASIAITFAGTGVEAAQIFLQPHAISESYIDAEADAELENWENHNFFNKMGNMVKNLA